MRSVRRDVGDPAFFHPHHLVGEMEEAVVMRDGDDRAAVLLQLLQDLLHP